MRSIVIRTDSSQLIGSGHVIRCRNLARELRRRNAEVIFVCRRQAGDLIDLIEREFIVLTLPEHSLAATERESGDTLKDRELYKAWLGCSQSQDAEDTLKVLYQAKIKKPNWIVVDHYGLDADWEKRVKDGFTSTHEPKVFVIDDLADRPHHADLLLDQNYIGIATETRYAGLVNKTCQLLLGPHYALVGQEYAQLHPRARDRKKLRRLLVFFGGVDPHNLTEQTLQVLMDSAFADLRVDVVLGNQSHHRRNVEKLVECRPHTTLHCQVPSLAELILNADLAIGAGGTNTWERLCLRLPTLVITFGDDQELIAQALNRSGYIKHLGSVKHMNWKKIKDTLVEFQSKNLPIINDTLTDGWGISRLCNALMRDTKQIQLRHACNEDEALLLRWANDPAVRAKSFSPDKIEPSEHHRWFEEGLRSSNRIHFIFEDSTGCPIGQIRFDRKSKGEFGKPIIALIDISLDACVRGSGLAKQLVRLGLEALEKEWGSNVEAVAKVLDFNLASQATFLGSGFTKESTSQDATLSQMMTSPSSSFISFRKTL